MGTYSGSGGPCHLWIHGRGKFSRRIVSTGPQVCREQVENRNGEAMNSEPFVSVLTPVYNGEAFLGECIESVLAQSYQNWEYQIVNNCSTDRTLEIAQSYAQKDQRIRVSTNRSFVSAIENHNTAFRLVSAQSRYCKV